MSYMVQMLILIPVIAVIAVVVLYVLWWRSRKQDKKQDVIQFTLAGTIERAKWLRDLYTAKNTDEQGAVFCDIDAYRRRASGHHEMVQFCHQASAVPLFPGEQDPKFRVERLKLYKNQLRDIAIAWADRERANVPLLIAKENTHRLYKIAVVGTILIVLIISVMALLFSGKLHWPF